MKYQIHVLNTRVMMVVREGIPLSAAAVNQFMWEKYRKNQTDRLSATWNTIGWSLSLRRGGILFIYYVVPEESFPTDPTF